MKYDSNTMTDHTYQDALDKSGKKVLSSDYKPVDLKEKVDFNKFEFGRGDENKLSSRLG